MKKIDALLQKVEFFEKLAVYGDRKAFLKRLGQASNYSQRSDWEPHINPIISNLENPMYTTDKSTQSNTGHMAQMLKGWLEEPSPIRLDQLSQILMDVVNHVDAKNPAKKQAEELVKAVENARFNKPEPTV